MNKKNHRHMKQCESPTCTNKFPRQGQKRYCSKECQQEISKRRKQLQRHLADPKNQ